MPIQKALSHTIANGYRQGQQAKASPQQVEEGGFGKGGQMHGANRSGLCQDLIGN
jgi:hypothetical protein